MGVGGSGEKWSKEGDELFLSVFLYLFHLFKISMHLKNKLKTPNKTKGNSLKIIRTNLQEIAH